MRRYDITTEDDLGDAAERVTIYVAAHGGATETESRGAGRGKRRGRDEAP